MFQSRPEYVRSVLRQFFDWTDEMYRNLETVCKLKSPRMMIEFEGKKGSHSLESGCTSRPPAQRTYLLAQFHSIMIFH